jgi:hypothetical protein
MFAILKWKMENLFLLLCKKILDDVFKHHQLFLTVCQNSGSAILEMFFLFLLFRFISDFAEVTKRSKCEI